MQIDDTSSKSSSSGSPPATPTLLTEGPMEKRSRSESADIYADGDDESQCDSIDSSKLSVTQSHTSIISMEDDDFASDDEKVN